MAARTIPSVLRCSPRLAQCQQRHLLRYQSTRAALDQPSTDALQEAPSSVVGFERRKLIRRMQAFGRHPSQRDVKPSDEHTEGVRDIGVRSTQDSQGSITSHTATDSQVQQSNEIAPEGALDYNDPVSTNFPLQHIDINKGEETPFVEETAQQADKLPDTGLVARHASLSGHASVNRYGHKIQRSTQIPDDVPVQLLGDISELPSRAHSLLETNDALLIRYEGKEVRIDSLFLRDACPCRNCLDNHSGQKRFATADIPSDIRIDKAEQSASGAVHVHWANDVKGWTTNHVSSYSQGWLASVASRTIADEVSTRAHRGVQFWNRHLYERRLRFIPYTEFLKDTADFKEAVQRLASHGLVFVEGVPDDEKAVETIAQRIGPLKNTFYGTTWDVKDKPQAENVAYTSQFLGLHMDLLYMKYPPGIQLLHCLRSSCEGGESMFADAFYAAKRLYNMSPIAFEDLSTFPVTYRYNKGGHHYTDTKVTIELDKFRNPMDLNRASLAVHPPIANINWSPPFQGPFTVDRGQDDYGRKLAAYHRAAQTFSHLINDEKAQFQHRLQPGQCVLFDNRRVLHGRQKFQSGTGERWLKGAYLDMDDFASKLGFVRSKQFVRKKNGDAVAEAVDAVQIS